ncbi:hypothetical protein Csa_016453 [Cucumis sativus]|uniref:Uncharacterized protein n=1 Tax=Cucumis sativus TaxID=3659 RepID=A0A0A0K915_CUCSA|nr:hypothetical protein Csa_016453 [Cucumis sativus]
MKVIAAWRREMWRDVSELNHGTQPILRRTTNKTHVIVKIEIHDSTSALLIAHAGTSCNSVPILDL